MLAACTRLGRRARSHDSRRTRQKCQRSRGTSHGGRCLFNTQSDLVKVESFKPQRTYADCSTFHGYGLPSRPWDHSTVRNRSGLPWLALANPPLSSSNLRMSQYTPSSTDLSQPRSWHVWSTQKIEPRTLSFEQSGTAQVASVRRQRNSKFGGHNAHTRLATREILLGSPGQISRVAAVSYRALDICINLSELLLGEATDW